MPAPSRPRCPGSTEHGQSSRGERSSRALASRLQVARAGIEPATFRFSGGRSYQLSYLAADTRLECHTGNAGFPRRSPATLTGLEPATSAVTGRRANQLRHRAMLCVPTFVGGTPYGIRTRATALKGRRPRPLDEGGSSRISPDRLFNGCPLGARIAYARPGRFPKPAGQGAKPSSPRWAAARQPCCRNFSVHSGVAMAWTTTSSASVNLARRSALLPVRSMM